MDTHKMESDGGKLNVQNSKPRLKYSDFVVSLTALYVLQSYRIHFRYFTFFVVVVADCVGNYGSMENLAICFYHSIYNCLLLVRKTKVSSNKYLCHLICVCVFMSIVACIVSVCVYVSQSIIKLIFLNCLVYFCFLLWWYANAYVTSIRYGCVFIQFKLNCCCCCFFQLIFL